MSETYILSDSYFGELYWPAYWPVLILGRSGTDGYQIESRLTVEVNDRETVKAKGRVTAEVKNYYGD